MAIPEVHHTRLTNRNIEFEEPTASIEVGRFLGGASPAFVTVSVSAPSVAEDGGTNLRYTFTRNGSTAAPLVANFAITGTAAASDFGVTGATTYTGRDCTVTFLSGRTTTRKCRSDRRCHSRSQQSWWTPATAPPPMAASRAPSSPTMTRRSS